MKVGLLPRNVDSSDHVPSMSDREQYLTALARSTHSGKEMASLSSLPLPAMVISRGLVGVTGVRGESIAGRSSLILAWTGSVLAGTGSTQQHLLVGHGEGWLVTPPTLPLEPVASGSLRWAHTSGYGGPCTQGVAWGRTSQPPAALLVTPVSTLVYADRGVTVGLGRCEVGWAGNLGYLGPGDSLALLVCASGSSPDVLSGSLYLEQSGINIVQ